MWECGYKWSKWTSLPEPGARTWTTVDLHDCGGGGGGASARAPIEKFVPRGRENAKQVDKDIDAGLQLRCCASTASCGNFVPIHRNR
ncbi:uncharacterized protein LOC143900069 isoform X2 [Temnothorax americanus]|uniref:uncharacterized protein LOC143900069 isoform X2 n=1 Tax=Temnothorax americanus TaxID=1964332 RepID=UPI004068DF41